MTSSHDRDLLRQLARHVAQIAALPRQRETISLWKRLNSLKPARPMVMIAQIPWHEMNVEDELTLRTEDPACHGVETHLRRTLYRWKHLPVDYVVEPFINVPPVIMGAAIGPATDEDRAYTDPQNDVYGHIYHDQIQADDDIEQKITMPQVRVDHQRTARKVAWLQDIFDGILQVRVEGVSPMLNLWDQLVCWRGVEGVLIDLADRPQFMHKLIARLARAYTSLLDQFEALGLLAQPQSWIHCTGAFTDELPAAGYDPARPRAKDIWACGMAQIFGSVSPAMHQEFDLDYLSPLYQRFGLVYYGCCEPLHQKMDLVAKIPNVRKVSMSPWVNVEQGAQRIGGKLVFSRKPSPAILATATWDLAAAQRDLEETLHACARHNCPLELILKDISTVCREPQRLWQWAEMAMRLVQS